MARTSRKTKQKGVIIAVADSPKKKRRKAPKGLKRAGLQETKSQRAIGTITGKINAKKKGGVRRRLSKVRGVQAVEAEQFYQLPPKDSELQ